MPDISDEEYNRQRWGALVSANSLFNRPYLDLEPAAARHVLDPEGRLESVDRKRVLCLASGGGKQSVAFTLLGAQVTVLDLSDEVLERDREAARHYGVDVRLEQGDMRDLSRFPSEAFDIVYHPYSINFVPEIHLVFRGAARVLRPGGLYYLMVANPFTFAMGTHDWTGEGYLLRLPYVDGQRIERPDEDWTFEKEGVEKSVPPSREYRHTLGTIVNGLVDNGFRVDHLGDYARYHHTDANAEPGSWNHFTAVAPPWFYIWASRDRRDSAD